MGKDLIGWGMTFRSVAGNPDISLGARALYSLLVTYRDKESNVCFPGSNLLEEHMGSSRQQINLWFKELEKAKVLKRHTRFNNLNGRQIRTIEILDDNNQ